MRRGLTLVGLLSLIAACGEHAPPPEVTSAAESAATMLPAATFMRGDVNADQRVDLSDVQFLANWLSNKSLLPKSRLLGCKDAADANDDGRVDFSDVSYIASFLYSGGDPPAAPHGELGTDPTADDLDCLVSAERGDPSARVAINDPAVMLAEDDDGPLFSFDRVIEKIIDTSRRPEFSFVPTPLSFYTTMFNTSAIQCDLDGVTCALGNTLAPNEEVCSPFPTECTGDLAKLADNDPFTNTDTNPDSYIPVAIFNRIDTAPDDFADCGEQRIVFGKRSGLTNPYDRNFVIFEARIPNPGTGLDGCRPILDTWEAVHASSSAQERAELLATLFYDGVGGVRAAMHADNFRFDTGQVRTNTVQAGSDAPTFREYRMKDYLPGAAYLVQTTVADNPHPSLFTMTAELSTGDDPVLVDAFHEHFALEIVPQLIADPHKTPDYPREFEMPQSRVVPEESYANAIDFTGSFSGFINTTLPPGLTVKNVVDRATAQTCAGCHMGSFDADLGNGVRGPVSLGFFHVDETGRFSHHLLADELNRREDHMLELMD